MDDQGGMLDSRIQGLDDPECSQRSASPCPNIVSGSKRSLPRAQWNHQMKSFLVEQLKNYDVPGYRTKNAWSKKAWNNMVDKINQKFGRPLTLVQVKQKEQDLKKDFRTVKGLLADSGFCWDPNGMKVVAPDVVWDSFGKCKNKDALIWRDKSFPYFDDLFALYEGRYAEEKNGCGMSHYAYKAKGLLQSPLTQSHETNNHDEIPLAQSNHDEPTPPDTHAVDELYMHFSLEEEGETAASDFPQQQSSSSPSTQMHSPCVTASGSKRSAPRAKWNHQMKLFLIEQLKDHDVPGSRTHNAWSKEAWNSIVDKLNQKFGISLTHAQVKQKEQDLKKDFRTVKDLLGESGFGWDPNGMKLVAPDVSWNSLRECKNKDALIWRDKSFLYFDDLFPLYEGRYAKGKNRHGMNHYANKAKGSSQMLLAQPHETNNHDAPSPPDTHAVDEPYMHFSLEEEGETGNSDFPQQQSSSKRSTLVDSQFVRIPDLEARCTKRQHNNEFQEKYLKLKKEEIDRQMAIEEKKLENPYSINRCITALEGLPGLQMADMLVAADIFKIKENREIFLSFSSDALRLGWVTRQIGHSQTN